MQQTWVPTTRVLVAGVGVVLLGRWLHRPVVAAILGGGVGVAVLARCLLSAGATRYKLLEGTRAVMVRKSICVDAPIEDVFDLWSRPDLSALLDRRPARPAAG
jgi:uncharacterized membrane protein